MTRNSKKLNPKPNEEQTPDPNPAKEKSPERIQPGSNQNPFGLSFVVPTQKVPLPSQGKYYPAGTPLYGVEELEIRHMTAKEEDILATVATENQNIFEGLIDGLLVDNSISASELLEEDKMALLLAARTTGYGHEYIAPAFCMDCDATHDYVFDLRKQSFLDPPEGLSAYNPENNSFSLTLPLTGLKLQLLNYDKNHQQELEADRVRKEKLKLKFNGTIAFLKKVIVSANDIDDSLSMSKLIDVMPAGDAKAVRSFFESCRPKLSTMQEVSCPKCKSPSSKEVPLSWAFFRTDI